MNFRALRPDEESKKRKDEQKPYPPYEKLISCPEKKLGNSGRGGARESAQKSRKQPVHFKGIYTWKTESKSPYGLGSFSGFFGSQNQSPSTTNL